MSRLGLGLLLVSCLGCAPGGITAPVGVADSPAAADNEEVRGRGEGKDQWWQALPRPAWSEFRRVEQGQDWFEVYEIRPDVLAIYEPGQFEEVISYLIVGSERALLFDTGLGIGDMHRLVDELTDREVVVLNSHTHYDHVGGNHAFETVYGTGLDYTRENARGRPHEEVAEFVGEGWIWKDLPEGFSVDGYRSRPFTLTAKVEDGQVLSLGGVELEVLLTPGHAPDSLCLLDRRRRLLFTGDTFYPATLYAHLPGSSFSDYEHSAARLASLADAVDVLLPAHNEPTMAPGELVPLRDAFAAMREGTNPFVLTDGNREYDFGRFSMLVPDPPPWLAEPPASLGAHRLQFVAERMRGDFILRAEIELPAAGVDPERRMGWRVGAGLDPGTAEVDVAVYGDGRASFGCRRAADADREEIPSLLSAPDVLQLERKGTVFILSVARYGEPFVKQELSLDLGDEVFAELVDRLPERHGSAPQTREGVFRNVRVIVPPVDGWVPYQDYIGSNLEILDVETGRRQIVHGSPDSLQAPNWTPDGKHLIYNSGGLLYRFNLERETSEVLDTGFADQNNNDHVLSFDGTMIGISHHDRARDNVSLVYTLPVAGGTPAQITPEGPSYLHGWSPDGKLLTYTAERGDGNYDIYAIPAEGGEEIRLTSSAGLDDGSEYSPDGRFIYFNSVRSGSMEIWRMKADGSEPQQLTDDELNNWFPHLSPDGTRIVFLSYLADVDPSDHPFYRQVYLRLMPADGSAPPRVIAYVYGGQGTINVPSWSPDGTRVAFVSNTRR